MKFFHFFQVDQTVEGMYIILSNIAQGTSFVHQRVTNCGFRKLVRYKLSRKSSVVIRYGSDVVKPNGFQVFCAMKFEKDSIGINLNNKIET
mgnify:FL=1